MAQCKDCEYSKVVASKGDPIPTRDPHGFDVERFVQETVLMCRYGPPINGWPVVAEDDWCSKHA